MSVNALNAQDELILNQIKEAIEKVASKVDTGRYTRRRVRCGRPRRSSPWRATTAWSSWKNSSPRSVLPMTRPTLLSRHYFAHEICRKWARSSRA